MSTAGRTADDAESAGGDDADLDPAPEQDSEQAGGGGRLRRASDILGEVLFGGGAGRAKPGEGRRSDLGADPDSEADPGRDPAPGPEKRRDPAPGPGPARPAQYVAPAPSVATAPTAPRLTTPSPSTPTWSAPAPGDEATRYLCAATHLDAAFTRRALKEFVFDEGRAPAPASGVDEVLVLRHALAARTRRLHRDMALVALIGVALLVSVWTVAAWLVWGAGLRLLLAGAGRGVPGDGQTGRPEDWAGSGSGPADALRPPQTGPAPAGRVATPSFAPLARFVALVWGVAGAGAIASAAGLAHPFGLRVPARFHDAGPGAPWVAWLFVPLAGALTAWLIVLAERLAARHVLVDKLRRDRFGTHRWITTETVWARRALAELAARAAQRAPGPGRPRAPLRRLGPPGPAPPLAAGDRPDPLRRRGPDRARDRGAGRRRAGPGPGGAARQGGVGRLRGRHRPGPGRRPDHRRLPAPAALAPQHRRAPRLPPLPHRGGPGRDRGDGLPVRLGRPGPGPDRDPRLGPGAGRGGLPRRGPLAGPGRRGGAGRGLARRRDSVPRLLFAAPAAAAARPPTPGAGAIAAPSWTAPPPAACRPPTAPARRCANSASPPAQRRARPAGGPRGPPFAREDANLALAVVERRVREALRPLL